MFSFKYEPRYGDYKDYDTIKPGSVLDMIQDVSTRASADCGYDMNKLRDMKRAWLLQGINVRFDKPIRPDLPIEIFTAIKPCNGVTSERCCLINQSGELVGKSIANWFIFNVERQRPTRIPEEMLNAYEICEFDDAFFNYRKAETHTVVDAAYTIKVSNKEIDTNKHMNNQRGAEILMDALPYEFYFNEINIIYKKPTYLGNELEVCVKPLDNDGYYVHLQTSEKEICVAGTFLYNI